MTSSARSTAPTTTGRSSRSSTSISATATRHPSSTTTPVPAGERDVRRGFLGAQRQRPRGGLLPRDQREPPVAALQHHLQRVSRPVRARGPAPGIRRTPDSGLGPAAAAGLRRDRRPPFPGHRDGLRGRVPHRDALLPPHRPGLRSPDPARRQPLLPGGGPPASRSGRSTIGQGSASSSSGSRTASTSSPPSTDS